ncbi:hypothetical protein MSG28_010142 [Choristoneura fumiferana]|uniref:Uncharacterized protein n=1 Tax=Choristoneura fumiferana TaxID=7141 RepID=A0ACC0KJV6_CHOFU|nr:hypothetical protein MSG28_010142 [Choristoneura fumiferana]
MTCSIMGRSLMGLARFGVRRGYNLTKNNVSKLCRKPGSHYYCTTSCGMKVTICGAGGNTGQPLALLLKQCPLLDEIALYDQCPTCGFGMELSHVDTKCKVSSYSGRHMLCDALKGSRVVVIVVRNSKNTFENNAPAITEIALQICNVSPSAFTIVATEPVESMVPIVAEIQRLRGVYNPRKLLGCVELNCVRANTVECVTSCIMSGNEAVCMAKGNTVENACLAGAYAVARNTVNVVKGLKGLGKIVQCAYVDSLGTCAPCCQFFASDVYTMCTSCCCSACCVHPGTCLTPPVVPCVPPTNWISRDTPEKFQPSKTITTNISQNTSSSASPDLDETKKQQLEDQKKNKVSLDTEITVNEEYKDITMKSTSASGRPGCSYIEQYSHIPETSAFQRLSPSKATTIEKEHNSEQYGRDFTTYDGITARGRRQTASVPYKRDDAPKMAAERLARGGVDGSLERAVLAGQGRRLLAEADPLPLPSHLASLVAKCEALHDAVEKGSLLELQVLLCRDEAGAGLLHKAVYYDYTDIAEWLVDNYPQLVHQKDSVILSIKRHNIRIWCHDCDMARLQRVVWEGHGSRLLSEVSNQPVVKKFLEAVPYMMHSGDPVTPQALSSRDVNNMTVMHKTTTVARRCTMLPRSEMTNTRITRLWGSGPMRRWWTTPQEIDKNILKTIPEAPRTASSAYPSSWDWKLLDTGVIAELNKKSRRKMKASTENLSSKNNTNTISESVENRVGAMKQSSTHEFIKDLPELDDSARPEHKNDVKTGNIIEDSQVVEEPQHANEEHGENEAQEEGESAEDEAQEKEDEHVEEHNEETEENPDKEVQDADEVHVIEIKDEDGKADYVNKMEDSEENTTEHVDSKRNDDSENHNMDNHDNENETGDQTFGHDHIGEEHNHEKKDDVENHSDIKSESNLEENKVLNEDEANHKSENSKLNESNQLENDVPNHEHEDTNHREESSNLVNDHKQNSGLDGHENDDHNKSDIKEAEDDQNKKEHNTNDEKVMDADTKVEEESFATTKEGNNNNDHSEDDDDVQVQGDCNSEYSDTNLRSTAELSDTKSAKRGNLTDGRSTQESLIEGIISGEAELDYQDASITQREESVHADELAVDSEIDPEVTELINSANMEMLAALVLNGEGSRLIGRRSGNAELQAFLDNVSTYMQKINKVHLAAKDGNIRDLQAALDRRKFAIARDSISPNGATPLHVATVFGKTNIMKYLGGRFPETLSAVDFEGRTALHYAAILPDNGHYFNLLQQLGANAKDLDDNGRSAEDYQKNPSLLPFNQLISDFGISKEAAQEMLSDKVPEDQVSSRRILDAPEALDTLERCYRLLASARPARTPLSASSNRATPPLVLGRFLKRSVFEALKHRVTKLDHDLFDVIWPAVKKLPESRNVIQTVEEDFPGGVTAPDYYVYEVFHEFLIPLIKDLHNINVHSDLSLHPPSDFVTHKRPFAKSTSPTEPLVELNVDPNDEFVLSGTIECSRNMQGFELPINLKIGKLEAIERIITTILMRDDFLKLSEQSNPESDQKGGTYYTMNEILEKPSEISASLAAAGLLIALCDREEIDDYTRLHGRHWPYGRGVYVSDDKTFAVWINVHDHIRVLMATPAESPGEIGLPFSKIFTIMSYLHEKIDFVLDSKLGYLSSRPTFLGSAIRFSLIVNFPGLSKDSDNMKHLCAMRGLQYRETLSPEIARISNYQCLSITESNCFNDFTTAASNLLHLEKDLSMQNSAHIATMLTNIFRRKRSSLTDLESRDNHEKP